MTARKNQSGFAPVVAIVLIAVLTLGGVGTVTAADNAKPGDILYPIDTGVENLRISLATSSESEVELHTQFAAERITEVQQLLQEKGVDPQGLNVALANLTAHKVAVAKLVTQEQELDARANALDDLFDQKEEELEAAFKAAKRELKVQRADLKTQLAQAIADGDVSKADSLRAKITQIEAQVDALDAQKEAAEEALKAEEDKLEAQLGEEEKTLEEKEEELERQEEELEEEEERLREEAEEKDEREREVLEEEAERVKEEAERVREETKELRESSEEKPEEKED